MNVLDALDRLLEGAVPGVVVDDPTDPEDIYTSGIRVEDWDAAVALAAWLEKNRVSVTPMGIDMCKLSGRQGSIRVSSTCPLWVGTRVMAQVAVDLGYDTLKSMSKSRHVEERISELSTLLNERIDAMAFATAPVLDGTGEVLATLIGDAMKARYGYDADSLDATAVEDLGRVLLEDPEMITRAALLDSPSRVVVPAPKKPARRAVRGN